MMAVNLEKLRGVVERVTFHSEESGWSVLKVRPMNNFSELATVTVHQTKVFAGATMEFAGTWTVHPRFGRQFKAVSAVERKPATTAALEKYLGSGLIKGVGPKTAQKIVKYFGDATLDIFEDEIGRLVDVPGIARKKLTMIKEAWDEHRLIREVMIFLQGHGISTLFAVRIYKQYKDRAIELVCEDPYRLALDFYGIGFFSADKVALSLGLAVDSPQRVMAAIKHVLAGSREQGHCFLTYEQIAAQVQELLNLQLDQVLPGYLEQMESADLLKTRKLADYDTGLCYYSKALYYDELAVARKIKALAGTIEIDEQRVRDWLAKYCRKNKLKLSPEQEAAVAGIVGQRFSVLTGGPGCGKTTATRVLAALLEAMNLRVLLAAPTGRAAQRMTEVIGLEAKTIHRLLEWQGGKFKKNTESPLEADFLIVDECSMLDISLSAALLEAVPPACQTLFIGDADQLPSVGAGNVLRDLIASRVIPCYKLTTIFRQANESMIISFAHEINRGRLPYIESPFANPRLWQDGKTDCLFIDAEEATQEQLRFISRVKQLAPMLTGSRTEAAGQENSPYEFKLNEPLSPYQSDFAAPPKFAHVDLAALCKAEKPAAELREVLNTIHPWSALNYGLTAVEVVKRLYLEWIPKYYGRTCEIQVLAPMIRGSLGTANLNTAVQQAANPAAPGKGQLQLGERIFRVDDRVIHRRNNYDLEVFNGDIGTIRRIDNESLTMEVEFQPEGKRVIYQRDDLVELDLAYAITIHKSQGSEFEAVIIPVLSQHFKMLFRNLVYTGLTRARKLAVFVGTRRAMAMAVHNQDTSERQTALRELLSSNF